RVRPGGPGPADRRGRALLRPRAVPLLEAGGPHMTLTAAQFPDFYRAVNGYKPFPWQGRLVEEVVKANGLWPAVLDLPTSAGKTSALDAAVFLLALQAGESVHKRRAGLRTFFVVDRRVVVDEAAEKARK